jgi:uncharacterized membrane protein
MTAGFRTLLVASLLVNVFAVGALGGGAVMLSRPGLLPVPGRAAAGSSRPIVAAGLGLPQPDRMRFRQSMMAVLRENKDLLQTARDNRLAAAQLFTQPQFDEAPIDTDLTRAADAESLLRARLQITALNFAASLPVDERDVLAQGLARAGMLKRPTNAGTGAHQQK